MKKYVLVCVTDRDIDYSTYSTKEEAQDAMRQDIADVNDCVDFKEFMKLVYPDLDEDHLTRFDLNIVEDEDFGVDADSGWLNDGPNHSDYDWKIIEVNC